MAVVGLGRGLVGVVDITAIELEVMQRCEPSICQPLAKDLVTASLGLCLFLFYYFINK